MLRIIDLFITVKKIIKQSKNNIISGRSFIVGIPNTNQSSKKKEKIRTKKNISKPLTTNLGSCIEWLTT
jgi:hypothetical protein